MTDATQQPPQPTPATVSDELTPPADWQPRQFRNRNTAAAAGHSIGPKPFDHFEPVPYADEMVGTTRRKMAELEATARAYHALREAAERIAQDATPSTHTRGSKGRERRLLWVEEPDIDALRAVLIGGKS